MFIDRVTVEARIMVPDARFEWLVDLYKPVSRVPAALTCIDIAGLTAVCFDISPALRQYSYIFRELRLALDWATHSSHMSDL